MLSLKCWMEEGSDAKCQVSGLGLALIINIKLHYITREIGIYSNHQLFFSRRRNVSSATFESRLA